MSGKSYSLELLEPRVMLSADGLAGGLVTDEPAYDPSAFAAIEVAQDSSALGFFVKPATTPHASVDDLFEGMESEFLRDPDGGGDKARDESVDHNGLVSSRLSSEVRQKSGDITKPTISSVSSSTLDGTYGIGKTISIQVTFSEVVNVVGSPTLALNSKETTSSSLATYSSGTGSSVLTFNYTVVAGHSTADLNYSAIYDLALPTGTTIKDLAGNTATLTLPTTASTSSLGGSKAIVINTTASNLAISTQPVAYRLTGWDSGGLSSRPVVRVQNNSNALVPIDDVTVTVVVASGSSGSIVGTTAVKTVGGVATFNDLVFTGLPGQSYTLKFSSVNLGDVVSVAVTIPVSPALPQAYPVTPNIKTDLVLGNLISLGSVQSALKMTVDVGSLCRTDQLLSVDRWSPELYWSEWRQADVDRHSGWSYLDWCDYSEGCLSDLNSRPEV
jgi:hypothetical protein